MSPITPLPSLGNLDPTIAASGLRAVQSRGRELGRRGLPLHIDSVFAKLETALADSGMDLGGATHKEWAVDSHPCIKVRITAGRDGQHLQTDGGAPLTLNSDQRKDRHIAQRNWRRSRSPSRVPSSQVEDLHRLPGRKGVNRLLWSTAADGGVRALRRRHQASLCAYVAKGGKIAGFEEVREGVAAPFPDAVILRQTKERQGGRHAARRGGARQGAVPRHGARHRMGSVAPEAVAARRCIGHSTPPAAPASRAASRCCCGGARQTACRNGAIAGDKYCAASVPS